MALCCSVDLLPMKRKKVCYRQNYNYLLLYLCLLSPQLGSTRDLALALGLGLLVLDLLLITAATLPQAASPISPPSSSSRFRLFVVDIFSFSPSTSIPSSFFSSAAMYSSRNLLPPLALLDLCVLLGSPSPSLRSRLGLRFGF